VSSHNHYGAFAIGGSLIDGSPRVSKSVGGHSFITDLRVNEARNFIFQAAVTSGQQLPFAWEHFEYLARSINPSPERNIHTFCAGGRVDMATVLGPQAHLMGQQGSGSGLVVFNTADAITIGSTAYGRQFQFSVLAPFSEVRLEDGVGFVEGYIIARSLRMGRRGSATQIHGRCFDGDANGGVSCSSSSCPVVGSTPAGSYTCADTFSPSKCVRKSSRGKCAKRKMLRRCALTCGAC